MFRLMKTLFRWAFRLFILLIVLLVAAVLLMDTIVRAVAERSLRRQTGLDVKIGKFEIGLLNSKVTIENLVIYNSAEFGGSPLIDMPELHVEYDRDMLFANKLHFKLVRFNLAQLNIVEDAKGRRNLDVLQKHVEATVGPPVPTTTTNKNSGQLKFAGIETLNLSLGKATFLRMAKPMEVEELPMNIRNQVFTNIKNEDDFSSVMVVALIRGGVNVMATAKPGHGPLDWLKLVSPPKK
jgi:uncharacterized protein involved in outer membrane biogenesis